MQMRPIKDAKSMTKIITKPYSLGRQHHPPRIEHRPDQINIMTHQNGKVKVVVTQSNIIVNELPKKEAVGYAYDWLRRQQRKREEEEKKLKKLDRKMKKLTKHRKK